MRRLFAHIALVALLCVASVLTAQEAVPAEMMQRTIFIKFGNESGTGFTVDYKGKIYLITARHVASGVPLENAVIQVFQQGQWRDYHTVRTFFPAVQDVDIAVFETNEKVAAPYAVQAMAPDSKTGGVTMGQQVWFLGYPFGIGTHFGKGGATGPFADGGMAPFVKRGTMSAIDGTNPAAVVLYIDGFNNPGFSGGPIIYWDFTNHRYAIVGVVQGYKEDSAKVLINGQHVDTQVLVNTGILVGYSIAHAIETIEAGQSTSGKTQK